MRKDAVHFSHDIIWMPLYLTRTMQNCLFSLVELLSRSCYHDVKNNSKGGTNKRKTYIDNIRWMTVIKACNWY